MTSVERVQHFIGKACGKTKPTQRTSALSALSKALEHTETLSDVPQRTHYFNAIASACEELGLIDQCIEVSNRAYEEAQKISHNSSKSEEYSELGSRYLR